MLVWLILAILWRPVGRPLTWLGDKVLIGLLGTTGELVSGRRQPTGAGLRRWFMQAAVWAGMVAVACLPFTLLWPLIKLDELWEPGTIAAVDVVARIIAAIWFLWLVSSFLWIWFAARRTMFEPELFQHQEDLEEAA